MYWRFGGANGASRCYGDSGRLFYKLTLLKTRGIQLTYVISAVDQLP